MGYQYLIVEEKAPTLEVILHREEAYNALNRQLVGELRAALTQGEKNPAIRFLLLHSHHPRAFCAGADIREMYESSPEALREFIEAGQELMHALEESPLIAIALIQGVCLGGGCELALACDFLIATPDAQFALPEVTLALHPGFGGTQRLPRSLGLMRALGYILTGKRFSGEEAQRFGLVWELSPPEELLERGRALIAQLASLGPEALVRAKRLTRAALHKSREEGCKEEAESFLIHARTPEAQEGLRAFLEKRKPRFS